MYLFQTVDFISHAGLPLNWKIECDALSDDEWKTIAKMIREYESQKWQYAVGIPTGATRLGEILTTYGTGSVKDPVLIVDDVYTTGKSFIDFEEKYYKDKKVIKWAVFARKRPTENVNVLLQLPG
jgi:adenine/guanine phosphoribosyltransferase-like PRPP-binding protein